MRASWLFSQGLIITAIGIAADTGQWGEAVFAYYLLLTASAALVAAFKEPEQ